MQGRRVVLAQPLVSLLVATGTGVAGQYPNIGRVDDSGPETTAVDGIAEPVAVVTDGYSSHYFGAEPAVDIEKATKGEEADDAPGVLVTVGGEVEWTYVVTNTGNLPLVDVVVTDDLVDAS